MWNLYLLGFFFVSVISILTYHYIWYKRFIKKTYGFMDNKNIKIGKDISRTDSITINSI